jgi:hypothetical protein
MGILRSRASFPTPIKVILRLDGQQSGNAALPLFSCQVLRVKTEVVAATAAAPVHRPGDAETEPVTKEKDEG